MGMEGRMGRLSSIDDHHRKTDMTHTVRVPYFQLAPKAFKALYDLSLSVKKGTLGNRLVDLVFLRASQINGCAYCIDMHSIDARAAGETEQRLYALDAWRETPFFDDRERAALAWIEAVTLVAQSHVPDSVYEEAKKHFSEREIVDLTYVAATINAWKRLAISLRAVPGRYRAASRT